MAPAVKTHKAVLQVLQSAKPNLRKAMIKESDKAIIHAICEICDNLLSGNIPLTATQKEQLKKYRSKIRQLAQKGKGLQAKKQVLQRGGSFLPLLLTAVASVLPSLFK